MTVWTNPTTWAAGNVPTAANLNAQWRDNLLHLHEQIGGFGYPYAPVDPRLLAAAASHNLAYPFYIRGYGQGTITQIRVYVKTAGGLTALGVYANDSETDAPGARLCTTTSATTPAIGAATVTLVEPTQVDIPAGSWFAWAGTTGVLGGHLGSTGWELAASRPLLLVPDVDVGLTDLPQPADPNFESSGSAAGAMMIGVP